LLAFKLRINTYPSQLFVFTNSRPNDNIALEIDSIQTILNKMQLPTKLAILSVDAKTQMHINFGVAESQRYIQQPPFGMVIPVSKVVPVPGGQQT
jgi:hypothetical protein